MKIYNPKTLQEVTATGAPVYTANLLYLKPTPRVDGIAGPTGVVGVTGPTGRPGAVNLTCCGSGKSESEDFIWLTHSGKFFYVTEMQTDHLFNAFRMLFNHGVSPAFRVGQFRCWPDIYGWSRDYKDGAFNAMYEELEKRYIDLTTEQKNELRDIEQNSKAFAILLRHEDPANPLVGEPYDVDDQPTCCV